MIAIKIFGGKIHRMILWDSSTIFRILARISFSNFSVTDSNKPEKWDNFRDFNKISYVWNSSYWCKLCIMDTCMCKLWQVWILLSCLKTCLAFFLQIARLWLEIWITLLLCRHNFKMATAAGNGIPINSFQTFKHLIFFVVGTFHQVLAIYLPTCLCHTKLERKQISSGNKNYKLVKMKPISLHGHEKVSHSSFR